MSSSDSTLKIIYFPKEKPSDLDDVLTIEDSKSLYRNITLSGIFCGSHCVDDFHMKELSSKESLCLNNCTNKVNQALSLQENIFKM